MRRASFTPTKSIRDYVGSSAAVAFEKNVHELAAERANAMGSYLRWVRDHSVA